MESKTSHLSKLILLFLIVVGTFSSLSVNGENSLDYDVLDVDLISLRVDPSNNGRLWGATWEGEIYYSDDHGDTWSLFDRGIINFSGLELSSQGTLFVSQSTGIYWETHRNNGTLKRWNTTTKDWDLVLNFTIGSYLNANGWNWSEFNGTILIGEYGNKFLEGVVRKCYVSKDDGITWTPVFVSLEPRYGKSYHIHKVFIDPYTGDWIVSWGDNSYGMDITTDEGETWSTFSDKYSAVSMYADENYVYFGDDEASRGVTVWERETSEFHQVINSSYPTWAMSMVNGTIIAYAGKEISRGSPFELSFYYGTGKTSDTWKVRYTYTWIERIKNFCDHTLTQEDNTGYVYSNTFQGNVWRIKSSDLVEPSTPEPIEVEPEPTEKKYIIISPPPPKTGPPNNITITITIPPDNNTYLFDLLNSRINNLTETVDELKAEQVYASIEYNSQVPQIEKDLSITESVVEELETELINLKADLYMLQTTNNITLEKTELRLTALENRMNQIGIISLGAFVISLTIIIYLYYNPRFK